VNAEVGQALRGSITPLVTPFRDGEIDEAAFSDLVAAQIDAGSHGVTVAGTTGEPASLSTEERIRLFDVAVRAAEGRVPIVAGVGTNELRSTLELTMAAERAGASALLVVTPYYVRPSQAGLRRWFEAVAGETSLPVILYEIPGRTAVALEIETVAALAGLENIVGIKVARPDLDFVSRLVATCGSDFAVYSGMETLCFPMLALGGAGHMSATANLVPREVAALADACFAGEWDKARELHYHLRDLNEAIFVDTNPVPVKAALALMGKITPEVRPPLAPLDSSVSEGLAEVLGRYGLVTGSHGLPPDTDRRKSWVSANAS
jgi:4-hydroxy-tetrahydrodipicolinate synthase